MPFFLSKLYILEIITNSLRVKYISLKFKTQYQETEAERQNSNEILWDSELLILHPSQCVKNIDADQSGAIICIF